VQLIPRSDAFLGAEGCFPLLVGGCVAVEVDEDEDAAFGFEREFKRLDAGEQS